ncbi:MAG: hypothetical protein ABIO36_00890 [Pyrinomonadaceae bacterium]
MTYAWYDIFGTLGVGIILVAYVLLQIERLRSDHPIFSLMNAVGAAMILVSLWFDFNFSSFLMEFFWLVVSLFGVGKYFWPQRA